MRGSKKDEDKNENKLKSVRQKSYPTFHTSFEPKFIL